MVYADISDLATYLGIEIAALPTDATRLLTRASELVGYAAFGRIDTSDFDHLDAARMAVCAQVEYWIANGEGIEMEAAIKSKSVGKTSITYADTNRAGGGYEICDRARRALFLQGLLYRGATMR